MNPERQAPADGVLVAALASSTATHRTSRPPRGKAAARGTGAAAEGNQGVGEPRRSDEAGKRVAPEPAEQRGLVSKANFRREP